MTGGLSDPLPPLLSDPLIAELPEDCRGRWESFVEETLTETNRRNTVDLVSTATPCRFTWGCRLRHFNWENRVVLGFDCSCLFL